jgi:hypothetical protein
MVKKLMTQNLMMVEHAPNDSRSVSAMLKGKGDGRELAWLSFENANPEITDQELLMAQFSHEVRYGRIKAITQPKNPLLQKVILGFIIVLAIII